MALDSYPPEVLPVRIGRHRVLGVHMAHEGTEPCPLGYVTRAPHAQNLRRTRQIDILYQFLHLTDSIDLKFDLAALSTLLSLLFSRNCIVRAKYILLECEIVEFSAIRFLSKNTLKHY